MLYQIKVLAKLAGITTRALRHYDAIGLLPPAEIGANGYRLYNHASLLRLQQILFYRELGMPLSAIRQMIGQPDFDGLAALERHRLSLRDKKMRIEALIETLNRTISAYIRRMGHA